MDTEQQLLASAAQASSVASGASVAQDADLFLLPAETLSISLNGEPVDVDLTGAASVNEVLDRLAVTLGVSAHQVRLIVDEDVVSLGNGYPFEKLACNGGDITLVLLERYWWCAEHIHNGKPVCKIVMRSERKDYGDDVHLIDDSYEEIHYVDGSVWKQHHEEDYWQHYPTAEPLVGELQFVKHQLVNKRIHGRRCRYVEEFEAVPAEDPGEWEWYTNKRGERLERRVGGNSRDDE